jgi:hypothetical protein
MSEYSVKNYTEQNGEVTHIGGKLVIDEGGSVEGLPGAGSQIEYQADSTATTIVALKDDFNGFLAKIRAAGLMAEEEQQSGE